MAQEAWIRGFEDLNRTAQGRSEAEIDRDLQAPGSDVEIPAEEVEKGPRVWVPADVKNLLRQAADEGSAALIYVVKQFGTVVKDAGPAGSALVALQKTKTGQYRFGTFVLCCMEMGSLTYASPSSFAKCASTSDTHGGDLLPLVIW